jgi:ankyrin repeat domain-containing protein 13
MAFGCALRVQAAGARVRSRDVDGWKTIHAAIASENEDIMRLLVQREKEQAPGLLHNKMSDVAPRLAEVPDFYCEIQIDMSTWIPGVSRWLPSDTVKIWKRGGDLRFDITLVGFENGSWQRGNLSFLLLADHCQFLCLDHDEQTCTNLLVPGNALEDKDLASMVHFLMTTSIMTTDVDVSALTFTRKQSWLTKSDLTEDICDWKHCGVYDMSGMAIILRMRRPQNKHHKPPKTSVASVRTVIQAV